MLCVDGKLGPSQIVLVLKSATEHRIAFPSIYTVIALERFCCGQSISSFLALATLVISNKEVPLTVAFGED